MQMSAEGDAGGRNLINIDDLGLEQLSSLQKQIEREIEFFTESIKQLKIAAGKYTGSAQAIAELAKSNQGTSALIPLSESMYIRASLSDPKKTLVDIGTCYYVEMTHEKAIDYFDRKTKFITNQAEKVEALIRDKAVSRQKVSEKFNQKVQTALAQRQQQ
ncbi:pfd-5 [Pristionchus pacificus]|nr:pfd-5 [Pristionchus pacificus]